VLSAWIALRFGIGLTAGIGKFFNYDVDDLTVVAFGLLITIAMRTE
jgi:hypothetical protein